MTLSVPEVQAWRSCQINDGRKSGVVPIREKWHHRTKGCSSLVRHFRILMYSVNCVRPATDPWR